MTKTSRYKMLAALIAVLAAGLMTLTAPGQPAGAVLPPPNIYNGKIVFESDRLTPDNQPGGDLGYLDKEIFSMKPDGTGIVQLTKNDYLVGDDDPVFSPDGEKVVFSRHRKFGDSFNSEVYLMNADGTGQTRLTYNTEDDTHPTFSPDGKKIAFVSHKDGNPEIYVMNVGLEGAANQPQRLTNNPADDRYPVFSPDGKKIAFTSERDAQAGDPLPPAEVYAMSAADGSAQTNLTNTPDDDEARPAFSPSGQKLAYERKGDPHWNYQIYRMNADGTGQTRLTSNTGSDGAPAFSGDGKTIVFQSQRNGKPYDEIYGINAADGSGETRLTNTVGQAIWGDEAPHWQWRRLVQGPLAS